MMHGDKGDCRLVLNITLRLCVVLLALSSAMYMAASACISGSGAATFTSARFGAFVFFVVCSYTAFILEAAAFCLQLFLVLVAAPAQGDYEMGTEQQATGNGNGKARIALTVVDLFVTALLVSAMVLAFTAGVVYRDQIGACASFAGQVKVSKIVSVAAAVAAMLANLSRFWLG